MAGALQPRNGSLQKPRNTSRTLSMLGQYMLHSAPLLILALVLSIVGNVFQLIGPALCGRAIDAASGGKGQVDFQTVYYYALQMIVFYVASAALAYLVPQIVLRISQRTVRLMRGDLFYKLMRLPVKYFDTHQIGELLSRISYDIDTVNTSLSNDLVQILTSIITIVGALVMMIKISPLLVLVFVVTVPLSVLFTRFMTSRVRPLYHNRSKCLGALNGFAEERIGRQRAIRTYGVEAADQRQFEARNDQASQAYYEADCASAALGPSVNFINNLSLAAVSVFGALLYLGGGLSLGALSSFVLYSRKFSGPIRETADLLSDLQASVAAAERVLDLLDQPAEDGDLPGAREPGKLSGAISFRHVDFGYDPAHPVLRDFSADIPAGSMVAVVGPTGAGKTTLVSLLLRFYTPQKGSITIDGLPIQQYTRDGLRRRLAIVLQDGWLCGGTIAENIAYGVPGATRAQIEAAAKAACIHSFLSSLPDGYDTALTDSGAGLSKGQRQLLALARCFLSNADIVILDEATSDVDPETEEQISAALERLRRGRTCFLIAHLLDTVRTAERILVLQDGRIAEQGTHQQLLDAGGIYRVLYDAQFS